MTYGSNEGSLLAGDIGGTKTNLGLFEAGAGRPELVVMESYPSSDAKEFRDLVQRFLEEHPARVMAACFGIAGPVIEGKTKATNLPWVVSELDLKARFGWEKVSLINDLTATAFAVPVLTESELHPLNEGKPDPAGTIGLVAPGTGLGIALAVQTEGTVIPLASEGGHVDFAPRDEVQMDLLRHLWTRWPHVSVERLASGPGVHTIYSWLKAYRNHSEPGWLKEKMNQSDPSKVISETALAGAEPLCVQTIELFVSILGAVSGDLALTGMTTGGIYLGGGISPKILPILKSGTFMAAFTDKGRFSELLSTIPVSVILNDKAALLGAACHASR